MKKYMQLLAAGMIFLIPSYSFGDIPNKTKSLMKMVLEEPAKLNEYDDTEGRITNFMLLVSSVGVPEVIEAAIKNGAKVEARDSEGNTPLNYLTALNKDAVGSLDVLLKHTKNIDNKGGKGKTPLMMAIEHGQSVEFLEHLIKAGVDLNIISNNNTAISLAAEDGRTDVIGFLLSQKGIKVGPKAMQALAHIDDLDSELENFFPDFDFKGLTHTYKHNLIKGAQSDWIKLSWIKYRDKDDTFPPEAFKINGLTIPDYLAKKDTNKKFDASLFRQSDIWRLFKSAAFFLADGKGFPELKQQYIGEYQDKKGTRQVYDSDCKAALATSEEFHRNADMGNCIRNGQATTSPLYYGDLVEACQKVAIEEMYAYDVRNRNILRNCKTVPETYPYTEFGNGILRYTHKGTDIALVPVKKGEIVTKLDGIPYSKIYEEIVKKYGKPSAVKYENKAHYFYFTTGDSEWWPIVVVFIDKKIAAANDSPTGIMTFYVNENADTVMKNIIEERRKSAIKSFKEEQEYWDKIKEEHDKKVNSFSL